MAVSISTRGEAGNTVSDMMFGGNVLFQKNTMGDGFKQTMSDFNITAIRWPGGAISEGYFDPANPDVPLEVSRSQNNPQPFGDTVLTFTETMEWAYRTGTGVGITIPTQHILKDGRIDREALSDIRNFVKEALETGGKYADAKITGFEIGNEYWGTWMTGDQYGQVADHVIRAVQAGISDAKADYAPEVLIQVGAPWGVDFKEGGTYFGQNLTWGQKLEVTNQEIIDHLSQDSKDAITGLVSHYYFQDTGGAGPEVKWSEEKVASVWRDAGMDLPIHMTEWNTGKVDEGKPNFAMAGFMIEQFETMIAMGVRDAFVWPVNQRTPNDLAGPDDTDPGRLSANGAAFKLLSGNLTGMRLHELNVEDDESLRSSFYTMSGASVLFLSEAQGEAYSRNFDLASVAPARTHSDAVLRVTQYGIIRDPSMDQYVGKDAGARIVTIFSGGADALGSLRVNLAAYEVTMVRMEWIRSGDPAAPMIGTSGNDAIVADMLGQEIDGRGGDDTIIGSSGNDTLGGGYGNDMVYGRAGDDKIIGSEGDNVLIGGSGNDIILGGPGDERIHGGPGNDIVKAGAGDDIIYGGHGNDTIYGEAGDDMIFAGSGNNDIHTGSGRNFVVSGSGNDTITGGGQDTLYGGSGDDVISAGNSGSVLYGEEGNDLVFGGSGNDFLSGGPGNDFIRGGGGNDTLVAGNGHDTLVGGDGNDVFLFGRGAHAEGGAGTNLVWGGAGSDRFVFGGAAGEVVIKDFGSGTDRLEFLDDLAFSDLSLSESSGNVTIRYASGSIVLEGVDIVDLGSENFIF